MKIGKRFLAGFLVLVLCLGTLGPMPTQAANVFFTAINDRVLKLTNESMPIWSGGVLYAPYTTFDVGTNGVNWGIESRYNKSSSYITLFDLNNRQFLEFDILSGTCKDGLTGKRYSPGAILRGGIPYLPVKTVCEYFELEYSYREIELGSILRIKNEEVILSDNQFLAAAGNVLNNRLREYNQSQEGGQTTTLPTTPQTPSQEETPGNEQSVDTYLSFRCEDEEFMEALLIVLQSQRVRAMFFLPAELIVRRGDLVMWMLGEGHSIGLLARGETTEDTRSMLEQGCRALEEQVFLRTTVAMVPVEQRDALEGEGWICWNSTLDLTPGDNSGANYFSNRVINQLVNRTRATYLSLDVSDNTTRILPALLKRLDEEGFVLRTPLETRL